MAVDLGVKRRRLASIGFLATLAPLPYAWHCRRLRPRPRDQPQRLPTFLQKFERFYRPARP